MLRSLIDLWIGRYARPSPAAISAVAGLRPAVVVTGASRGIGLALARRFAMAGNDVVMIARTAEPLERAAMAVERDCSVRALPIALDVAQPDAPQVIDTALTANGYYSDILINSAGLGLAGPFASHDTAAVARLIDVNVTALTRLMHHILPGMLARGRGGILNVASVGGLVPGPYQAAYYASKAYVVSLSRAVGAETAGSGVRLMALAPGPVNTGFHEAMGAEFSFYRQLILPLTPEGTANAAYRAYVLGCRLVVPGVMNKMLALALWIVPHALLLPLVRWLLRTAEPRPWRATIDNEP